MEVFIWVMLSMAIAALCFVAIAALFAKIDLTDREQAFGLPRGTVRATLAVGLLTCFVWFAQSTIDASIKGSSRMDVFTVDSGTELESLPADTLIMRKSLGDGSDRITLVPTRLDPEVGSSSRQVFTTVATLLGSVVGFYFGSRSSAAAATNTVASSPGLSPAKKIETALGKIKIIEKNAGVSVNRIEVLERKASGFSSQNAAIKPMIAGFVNAVALTLASAKADLGDIADQRELVTGKKDAEKTEPDAAKKNDLASAAEAALKKANVVAKSIEAHLTKAKSTVRSVEQIVRQT